MDTATIEAGPALDALVAEQVMGWKRDEPWGPKGTIEAFAKFTGKPILGPWKVGPGELDARWDDAWRPSTDMAHAWEVVTSRYGWRAVLWQTSSGWACVLMPRNAGWTLDIAASDPRRADAATAPLAICRAALAAVAR